MNIRKRTMAQALIQFLAKQWVERDGKIETIRGHLLEAIAETKPPPSKNKAGGADAAF